MVPHETMTASNARPATRTANGMGPRLRQGVHQRNWRHSKCKQASETVQACRRCGYESTSGIVFECVLDDR
jgi:hypothetical protein